jgi:release factor glutamine methyltransferase
MTTLTQADATPWTIGRLLSWTGEYLARHGVDDARLASEVLLAHAVGCRRIDLYARFGDALGESPLAQFRESVRRAVAHEPVAYLVGKKEFFSLAFHVTPDVLIPRAETEELVECVIDLGRSADVTPPLRILDVGTGSGCIAVAVLTQLRDAVGVATDVSPAALEVARGNAEQNGVLDRMTLVQADRLALPGEIVPQGGFDVLMCNPPYIPAEQVAGLDAAVRNFEPHEALTDGGDGLSFYRALAEGAAAILSPRGVIVVEVGDGQADAVIATMIGVGMFVHRQTRKDRVVGQERVLVFAPAAKAGNH